MKRRAATAIAAALAGCVACGGSHQQSPTAPSAQFSTYSTQGFTFRYTSIDGATIAQMADSVEREHDRIPADLGVDQMPRVTVTLYPTRDALVAAVTPMVGSIPSFATGLVTGPDAIHLLPPRSSSDAAVTNTVHEYAHCVELRLNPRIGNNPRWLWESVALYEARQFVDPRSLSWLSNDPAPTLDQLSVMEDRRIYDVGGSIARFVVERWGIEALRALVRANGDVQQVLGVSDAAFVSGWLDSVR